MGCDNDFINCDNEHLSWETLFKMVSAVAENGGSAMRVLYAGGVPPTPCVDATLQLIKDSERSWAEPSDWAQSSPNGGSHISSGALVLPINSGTELLDYYYTNGDAFTAPFDETKSYILKYARSNNKTVAVVDIDEAFLTIQTDTRYVDVEIRSGATGLVTVSLGLGSSWSLGDSPRWASFGLSPEYNKVLFTLSSRGMPFDGFTLDTFGLEYEDCVAPPAPPDPCIDGEVQVLNDPTRMFLNPPADWAQSSVFGASSVNTGALVVPNNDGSLGLVSDAYASVAPVWIDSLDPSRYYTLRFQYYENAPENGAPIAIAFLTIQSGGRYVDIEIKNLTTGIQTFDLGFPSSWAAGVSPSWIAAGALSFEPECILFALNSYEIPFDGFTVGVIWLTYNECI